MRADRRPDGVCTLPIPVAIFFLALGDEDVVATVNFFLLPPFFFDFLLCMYTRPAATTTMPTSNAI